VPAELPQATSDTGALERLNVFLLPRNLMPHPLDFGVDMFRFHDQPVLSQ
jgi:hypothetical protein